MIKHKNTTCQSHLFTNSFCALMGLANLCFRRSASRLASSVCGGRVRSISTVANRPSRLRPFVSRGFLYSTAATDNDWISCEQAIIREIDSEFYDPVVVNKKNMWETFFMSRWKDRTSPMRTPSPESFPFKIENIPGNRTLTLTREYNGEHIKVVVSMPFHHDHDDDDDDDGGLIIDVENFVPSKIDWPLVVTVTKKSGRSLELHCRTSDSEITIDDIHVNLPGHSSEDPKVLRDMDDAVGMEHGDLMEKFSKYLKVRGLEESTFSSIHDSMLDKMKHEYWLWLGNVKEFLEE